MRSWLPTIFLALLGCSAAGPQPAPTAPEAAGQPPPRPAADPPDSTKAAAQVDPVESDPKEEAQAQTSETRAAAPTDAAAANIPKFFEGRDTVTYREFIDELRGIADDLMEDPDVQAAHEVLLQEKGLSTDELPLQSFSRARLAFESARDSGLWGIRGTVTDQMPWSDRIWKQWSERDFSPLEPLAADDGRPFPTAVGECDELGALFSILARDLGVIGFVGLHWPYWNHVVPVWQVDRNDGSFVRIIAPATQTFLDKEDTIGTTGLPLNRIVFPYVRKDVKPETELSADLVRYLLTQSHLHGGKNTDELTMKRLWHRWNNRPNAPAPKADDAENEAAEES